MTTTISYSWVCPWHPEATGGEVSKDLKLWIVSIGVVVQACQENLGDYVIESSAGRVWTGAAFLRQLGLDCDACVRCGMDETDLCVACHERHCREHNHVRELSVPRAEAGR